MCVCWFDVFLFVCLFVIDGWMDGYVTVSHLIWLKFVQIDIRG